MDEQGGLAAKPHISVLWGALTAALVTGACEIGAGGSADAGAPGSGDVVAIEPVVAHLSFSQPVWMQPLPDNPDRWAVLEKGGRILGVDSTAVAGSPDLLLDLTDTVESGPSEAGLLGLAFHPAYAQNGEVFVSYTAEGDPLTSRVSRFTSSGNGVIDADSEQVLLSLEQPFGNHNGGQIAFGPDGFLYIGFGDGGSGGDPEGNGQNPSTLLGALLRIDVDAAAPYGIPADNPFADGQGGRPEVYAWGLRNPWRWSFDVPTGRLWAGDVGQNAWEEIDLIEMGGNYGWNIREGAHCYEATVCATRGLIEPVAEYPHDEGCSVTGGYVYRGAAIPVLVGDYLFGDFCSGRVWALRENAEGGWDKRVLVDTDLMISSFARDADGELYLLDYAGGGIYRLVPG